MFIPTIIASIYKIIYFLSNFSFSIPHIKQVSSIYFYSSILSSLYEAKLSMMIPEMIFKNKIFTIIKKQI